MPGPPRRSERPAACRGRQDPHGMPLARAAWPRQGIGSSRQTSTGTLRVGEDLVGFAAEEQGAYAARRPCEAMRTRSQLRSGRDFDDLSSHGLSLNLRWSVAHADARFARRPLDGAERDLCLFPRTRFALACALDDRARRASGTDRTGCVTCSAVSAAPLDCAKRHALRARRARRAPTRRWVAGCVLVHCLLRKTPRSLR